MKEVDVVHEVGQRKPPVTFRGKRLDVALITGMQK